MKQQIKIHHDTNAMDAMDMVTGLFRNFGIPYIEVDGDGYMVIEYYADPNKINTYDKWFKAGFLNEVDIEYHRPMVEIYEELAKILLNTSMHQLFNWDINAYVEDWIFPIARRVYGELLKNQEGDNLGVFTFVLEVDKIYKSKEPTFDEWKKKCYTNLDFEAELCAMISDEMIKLFSGDMSEGAVRL